jgi:hypothetical protein
MFGAEDMKYAKTGLILIVFLLIGGLCAWMLRGEYDRLFMMNGHFHLVSNAKLDHRVDLHFPSGKNLRFNLKKHGFADFKLNDTGEGAIAVFIDGLERDHVGYVTAINGIVVLVIGEEQAEFSQIFPSLSTK